MVIRRALVAGLAVGALVLAGCRAATTTATAAAAAAAARGAGSRLPDRRHHPRRTRRLVLGRRQGRRGAGRQGHRRRPALPATTPTPASRATLIDNAVAAGTDGLVVSMANPRRPGGQHQGRRRRRRPGHHHQLRHRPVAGLRRDHPRRPERDPRRQGRRRAADDAGLEERHLCHPGGRKRGARAALRRRASRRSPASWRTCRPTTPTCRAPSRPSSRSSRPTTASTASCPSAATCRARPSRRSTTTGADITVGTFDVNADVVAEHHRRQDAVRHRPAALRPGLPGRHGIYLKLLNGNDIGGGQPVYSGPAIITKDNAQAVLDFAKNGTR